MRIAGQGRTRAGWIEPLRVLYDHELVLFRSGTFVVELDGRTYHCAKDSFIIIPPGRLHLSRMLSTGTGQRCWIHFDWIHSGNTDRLPVSSYFPAPPREHLLRPAPPWVPPRVHYGRLPSPGEIFDLFERLDTRWNYGTSRERTSCRALLLELLLEVLHPASAQARGERPGTRLAARIRESLTTLADGNAGNRPAIRPTLRGLGYSYAHLCRVFKREYGIAPLRYVNALRIERAKLLLRDTELTVSEVAERTGFDNLSYFSRLFSRIAGISPSAYRRHCPTPDDGSGPRCRQPSGLMPAADRPA